MVEQNRHRDDEPLSDEEVASIEGQSIGRIELDAEGPQTRTISVRLNNEEFRLLANAARARSEGLSTSVKRLAKVGAIAELQSAGELGYSGLIALEIPPSLHADAAEFADSQGVGINSVFGAGLAYYLGRHWPSSPDSTRLMLQSGGEPAPNYIDVHAREGSGS